MYDADDYEFLFLHALSDDIASNDPKTVTLVDHIRARVPHAGKSRQC
jgi:hypothetical protein